MWISEQKKFTFICREKDQQRKRNETSTTLTEYTKRRIWQALIMAKSGIKWQGIVLLQLLGTQFKYNKVNLKQDWRKKQHKKNLIN